MFYSERDPKSSYNSNLLDSGVRQKDNLLFLGQDGKRESSKGYKYWIPNQVGNEEVDKMHILVQPECQNEYDSRHSPLYSRTMR